MTIDIDYKIIPRLHVRAFYEAPKNTKHTQIFAYGCALTHGVLIDFGEQRVFTDPVCLKYDRYVDLITARTKHNMPALEFVNARTKQNLIHDLKMRPPNTLDYIDRRPELQEQRIFELFRVSRGVRNSDHQIEWKFTDFGAEIASNLCDFVYHAPAVLARPKILLMATAELLHRAIQTRFHTSPVPDELHKETFRLQLPRPAFGRALGLDFNKDTNTFRSRDWPEIVNILGDGRASLSLFNIDLRNVVGERDCVITFQPLKNYKLKPGLKFLDKQEGALSQETQSEPVGRETDQTQEMATPEPSRTPSHSESDPLLAKGDHIQGEPLEALTANEVAMNSDHTSLGNDAVAVSETRRLDAVSSEAAPIRPSRAHLEAEAKRLLTAFDGIVVGILKTTHLLRDSIDGPRRQMDQKRAQFLRDRIKDDVERIQRQEPTIPLFGLRGSGKSTTINAAAGLAIAPFRSGAPMTAFPTRIRHKPSNELPVLTLPAVQLDEIVQHVKTALTLSPLDGSKEGMDGALIDVIQRGELDRWPTSVEGEDAVRETLLRMHDLCRIAMGLGIDFELSQDLLPTVEVRLEALGVLDVTSSPAGVAFLDMPGFNESRIGRRLRKITDEQIERADACIVICDYLQMNVEAYDELMSMMAENANLLKGRVFVLINKIDARGSQDPHPDLIREQVARLPGMPPKERIFPTAANHAYVATWAKGEIGRNGSLSDSHPNTSEFIKLVMGPFPEDIRNADRVKRGIDWLWINSGFSEALDKTIRFAATNAQLLVLYSVAEKISEDAGSVGTFLKTRGRNAQKDKEKTIETIQELNKNLLKISEFEKGVSEDLGARFDRVRRGLDEEVLAIARNVDTAVDDYLRHSSSLLRAAVRSVSRDAGQGDEIVFDGPDQERAANGKCTEIGQRLSVLFQNAVERAETSVDENLSRLRIDVQGDLARLPFLFDNVSTTLLENFDIEFAAPNFEVPDVPLVIGGIVIGKPNVSNRPGVWAALLRLIGSKGGYLIVQDRMTVIKLHEFRKSMKAAVEDLKGSLQTDISRYETKVLRPALNKFFEQLRDYVGALRVDFEDSLRVYGLEADEHQLMIDRIRKIDGELDEVVEQSNDLIYWLQRERMDYEVYD